MPKKNSITFLPPDEPSFIKRMKEKIGYKEGPTVDTKREEPGGSVKDTEVDSSNREDDERPQVVVLKKGDLTQEEADEEIGQQLKDEGKILFKPRQKRQMDGATGSEMNASTKRSKPGDSASTDKEVLQRKSKDKTGENKHLQQKNSNLLSFDDEED